MINLNLTIDEVNVVIAGISKLTIEQGYSTWQKVVQQAQKQAAQSQEPQILSDSPAAD